ncbi:MAG: 30S ribosome-binding factor RbfA [Bdellovibrionales bacterium]
MRSQRQLRVGEEIRHALALAFQRGDVPWPADFDAPNVTVTEVQISPDLHNATVFVMPLGGLRLEETVRILNDMPGYFRHVIAQKVRLRHVPKLAFSPDRSFDYAQRISQILNDPEVAKDLADRDDD